MGRAYEIRPEAAGGHVRHLHESTTTGRDRDPTLGTRGPVFVRTTAAEARIQPGEIALSNSDDASLTTVSNRNASSENPVADATKRPVGTRKCFVLDTKRPSVMRSRLLLCAATVTMMRQCFALLGIEPPDRI